MTDFFELYQFPVTFHPDPVEVRQRYFQLSRLWHPDRFAQSGGPDLQKAMHISAQNNQAYKTFQDPDATMAYVLQISGLLQPDEKYPLPPAFLMEVMDINEALSDYESDPANEDARSMAVNALNEQLELWGVATQRLTSRFEAGVRDQELLLQIKDQYFRKKYLLRIKERIDKFAAR